MKYYLAIDIGASSGRHIIGYEENGVFKTKEIYRFTNGYKEENGHLIWDCDSIFFHILEGIKKVLQEYKTVESLSIDTWGVDYVLMNHDKRIDPVYNYRDQRTKEVIEEVHKKVSFERIYEITGSQFQEFNTIYQFYSDKVNGRLGQATDYLMMPEYFIYRLTGIKVHEYTNASTTSLVSLKTNTFNEELINTLGLPKKLFTSLTKPGSFVGNIQKNIQDEIGGNIPVLLCATHDTASAVESIELKDGDCYISSGTWSLLGIKLDKGINTNDARLANYSNEYGPNYIRFQKNIMGMWITQFLKRELQLEASKMLEEATKSAYQETFNANDSRLLSPKSMKETIIQLLQEEHKTLPKTDWDLIRSSYLSLACSYNLAIEELEHITGKTINRILIVGGGAKNNLLNELTKQVTKKEVIAYPIEATSIGNLMIQMKK